MQASPASSNLLQPTRYVRLRPQQLSLDDSDLHRRRSGALLMAGVALATLIQRRSSYDSALFIIVELVVCVGAIALASWLYRGGDLTHPGVARWRSPAVVLLLGLSLVGPWLLNVVAKSQGYGNGLEIVMLSSLSWVGLMAAGVGKQSRTISLSVVCNGFVALFATLISDSPVATWFAYAWVALCMWWLVGNQWEELNTQGADQLEFSRGLRWSYIVLGIAVFSGSVLLLGNRIPVWRMLQAEIMPTSGGTSTKDDAARSGVGNGDTLIAAKRHATSFGAVESDIFLDSEKPSLFDVFSDEFGLPKPKDKVERAQALKPQEDQGADGKSSEANRSTQTNNFSLNRQPPRYKEPPRDLVSSALLFWEGTAGAHLAVERFNRFDGQAWTQTDPTLPLEATYPESIEIEDRTWFYAPGNKFASSLSPYRGATAEAIKFTRFRSPVIPSRAGGMLWSIDQLTRADFFSYAANDCLSMVGREHVPDYTVVRFVNGQLELEKMDQLLQHCSPGTSHRIDSVDCQGAMAELAHHYSHQHSRGWSQVQAVIEGLRHEFKHVAAAESVKAGHSPVQPPAGATPLEEFLHRRRGPSYLFATAAALMLEHLGYETRLVTGFYVNPAHYISTHNEYAVQSQDAHVWLEVNAGHDYWIPLEPTPGFRAPPYTASWWYQVQQAKWQIAQVAGIGAVSCILVYVLRSRLFDLLSRLSWPMVLLFSDRQRVRWLGWLLDRRLALCGLQRPRGCVPRHHFAAGLELPEQMSQRLRLFLDASDALLFGNRRSLTPEQRSLIHVLWKELTVASLRKLRKPHTL